MRLKLFRAPTVASAMSLVREELGADALILSTRRSGAGVEVTAALEPSHDEASPVAAPVPVAPDPTRMQGLMWHGVPQGLAAALAAGPLEAALGARLRFRALDLSPGSSPLLVAGPPGAGKTLTVARLATRLVMQGVSPLVISTDAERAGAAEQLAAFTRLLDLPLLVAHDAVTLARALGRRQEGAPVLIDTAGIDPFSPGGQAGVAALSAAAAAEVALVLPAGLDAAESADTAAAFIAAGARLLVATRLDLARRIGGILAAAGTGLALAEAGIGSGAADGLQPMTAALLAGRLAPSSDRRAA